jgi:ParB-like chromosome segregation protein Spo0J
MTIHPAAAIFPMMSEEELQDLAADIKAHGLAHPIIIHENGDGQQLIDGRNRLRACEIAGVKPEFTHFHGDDPRAFILSVNVARRHLSKGQQAMAVALLYPEPEKGGRGKLRNGSETGQFSKQRLSVARSVLAFSRPLEDVAPEEKKAA